MSCTEAALLLALILLTFLTGCVLLDGHYFPPESALQSRHGVVLRGSFTKEDVEALDDLLSIFPLAVIKSIRSISIVNRDDSHQSWAAAFCHPTGDICVRPGYLRDYVIWHEAGHAHHFYLRFIRSSFNTEWEKLSKGTYTEADHYSQDPSYPKDGILTGYGSRNQMEDVAVYVEAVYDCLNLPDSYYKEVIFERAEQAKDSRFKSKIELLLKHGFISEVNYHKFRELVQLDSWK